MNTIAKLKSDYKSDKIFWYEWILPIFTSFFVFISISYYDFESLTIWSTNVWDSLLDGGIRRLYEISAQNIHNAPHSIMGSELLSVLPWSIWNLPIWALQRFAGVEILDSAFCLTWSKLFLIAVSVLLLRYTYLLAYDLTNNSTKSRWVVFLSASSVFLCLATSYAGQNDIIMLFVSVLAIYELFKGKKIAFYLLSALSVAIKPFYLFAYVAIILLIEKRILKIALKLLFSVSGILLQKLLFYGAPMYAESISEGPTSMMLKEMFVSSFGISFGYISFFALALILLYFYCYTRNFKGKKTDYKKYVIYAVTAAYICYLMLSQCSFYRPVLLIPFLYLLFVMNFEKLHTNLILESVMSVFFLLKVILRSTPLFWTVSHQGSVLQKITGVLVEKETFRYDGVRDVIITKLPMITYFDAFISTVVIVAFALLLLINHPSYKIKLPYTGERQKALVWLRPIIILPFMLLTLAIYYISA